MRHPERQRSAPASAWRVSVVAGLFAVAAGVAYLLLVFAPRERARAIDRWRAQLSAMADDRQAAIDRWLVEGLAQARTLSGYPSVQALVAPERPASGGSGGSEGSERHVRLVLSTVLSGGDFLAAGVVDARLRPLVNAGSSLRVGPECAKLVGRALASRRPTADLYRRVDGTLAVGFVAPVRTESGGPTAGAVLLLTTPERWLYPLLGHQPLASQTEETLLLQRDGDSAVFLSPLRLRAGPPLSLRVPLQSARFAGAFALARGRQFGEFVDYRGTEVLAATRHLDNAPWGLVAKVDREEALAGARSSVRLTALALLGFVVGMSASLLGFWLALEARSRARVARAEARFSILLDQASDAILLVGAAGAIVEANRRACELYGYPLEELRRRRVWELREDRSREASARHSQTVQQQGEGVWEALHVTREGRQVPVEIAARFVELRGEQLIVSIVRDVSERKQAEEALRASEARFRSLFENMLEGFAYCRMLFEDGEPADFVYVEVNQSFVALTGLSDVVGRRVSEVLPGIRETNREMFAAYGRVVATGVPEHFETYVPATGFWFSVSAYRPEPEHFVAVFENVTERKRTEEEVRRLNLDLERRVAERTAELGRVNEELRNEVDTRTRTQRVVERYAREVEDLYNHAPCGYHSLDAGGRFVAINDTELEWLGYSREEVLGGMRFTDVATPGSAGTFVANFAGFKERGSVYDLEFELVRKDGSTFWVLVSASAVRDAKGNYLRSRSTLFDITELVRARRQVAERTEAVEAANRELESFSYSVSHDLRAPLRAIEGFSRILETDHSARLDPEGLRLLGTVRESTRRMGRLIDDLLTFSRVGRSELRGRPVAMEALVADVVQELVGGHDSPSRLEIRVGSLPDTVGDPAMLRQVWVNLLSNAIKFTSPRPHASIDVTGRIDDGEIVYSVRDNGVGFDMRYAGKLFGVFQRLHGAADFPGTGVGLALVQRIVQRHGGRVWAEGAVDEGATFSFTLPVPPA